ncbi:protein le25 [Phtheirospermum japonicum]|uniref:Protein le25 n=1 Tax=Phtheirospermum japonicum TaxID=374723 RepID=A0A830C8Q0_9LAMI|nr:protein le25 [Phtheirospermum japonicum]
MQSAKNAAASAKAGMEKTKATMQEKAEKMTTRDPLKKEIATERKEERVREAERRNQDARVPTAAGEYSTGIGPGQPTAGYGGDIRQDYPQEMGGQADFPKGGTGLGSGGVGATDPNVGGGARTRHGSGGTM